MKWTFFWSVVVAMIFAGALFGLFASLEGFRSFSGGHCKPIGITTTDVDGQLWTCVEYIRPWNDERTGRGYWYKGKP